MQVKLILQLKRTASHDRRTAPLQDLKKRKIALSTFFQKAGERIKTALELLSSLVIKPHTDDTGPPRLITAGDDGLESGFELAIGQRVELVQVCERTCFGVAIGISFLQLIQNGLFFLLRIQLLLEQS